MRSIMGSIVDWSAGESTGTLKPEPKWSLRVKSATVLCFTPAVNEPRMLCSSPDSASALHLLADTAINLYIKELGLFQNHASISKTLSTTTGVPKRRRSGRKKRTVFPRDVFCVAEMEENRGLKRHRFETGCFSFEREEKEVGIGLKRRRRMATYGVADYMKESWSGLVCAF